MGDRFETNADLFHWPTLKHLFCEFCIWHLGRPRLYISAVQHVKRRTVPSNDKRKGKPSKSPEQQIFYRHRIPIRLSFEEIEKVVRKLTSYFGDWRLIANPGKTEHCVFHLTNQHTNRTLNLPRNFLGYEPNVPLSASTHEEWAPIEDKYATRIGSNYMKVYDQDTANHESSNDDVSSQLLLTHLDGQRTHESCGHSSLWSTENCEWNSCLNRNQITARSK